jgi:hypothetical protein
MTLLAFLAARLREPSSYAGLGMLLAALGVKPSETMLDAIVQLCVAGAGLVAVLLPEQPHAGSGGANPSSRLPPAALVSFVASSLALAACQGAGVLSAAADTNRLIGEGEPFATAACANPRQGDPVSTAVWLGTLVEEVTILVGGTPATDAS